MKNWIIKAFASGFFSGYSPTVPGTTGTVPAWLLAYFIIGDNPELLLWSALGMTVISVFFASLAEPLLGHDAKKIVIDEWAGMLIALLWLPFSLKYYAVAFVAFRLFDVLKLYPAAQAESLPSGWGVTADDVVAGLQANLATQLLIRIFWIGF